MRRQLSQLLPRRQFLEPMVTSNLAVATGAMAIGAIAIAAIAIGRLVVKKARIERLEIGELTIGQSGSSMLEVPMESASDCCERGAF